VTPELASNVIQVHNTYLVAQTDEGIIIVDQHALHERILYEKFREQLLAGPLESQRLLMPETLEVSPQQAQAAEQHRELLGRLGIDLSVFGPKALAVQAFPALLPDVDIHAFVADLLDKLAESEELQSEEAHLHKALDMMACKAAVKAGDPLSTEEMQTLLAQRHLVQKSSNCPHGRPTTLQLSTRDLEKQFKRV
jgi:DNA mismatch repair protein MutL